MKDKIIEIIISLGLFAIGLSLLLWAEKVTNTVSIVFGWIMIVYGLFVAFSYYRSKERRSSELIFAIILLIVGAILVIKPSIVTELISIVIGIYMIFTSLMKLKFVLEVKSATNYSLGLGLSIAGIVIGVLCILGKILIPNVVLNIVGVLLMIFSVSNIINVIALPKRSK